jgi:ribosomal-protein-serine acetyltransferase
MTHRSARRILLRGMPRSPLLIDIPVPITTPHLVLREPRAGDGAELNAAVHESFDLLSQWMPWARARPTLDESEEYVRRSAANWILREDLHVLGFDRATGKLAVNSGLHRIQWDIPSFEIGYWVRASFAGRGLVTETVHALTRFAFAALGARRVELRCNPDNTRSVAVIERLGFAYEGRLRGEGLTPAGHARDTLVHARLDLDALPPLDVSW